MTSVEKMLDVAVEFSAYPAGRDDNDGPYNGKKFRETMLIPRLNEACAEGGVLTVSLAGVRSFGSSFLEEAFGGLVRRGFSVRQIDEHLRVVGSEASGRYVLAIEKYISRAKS